MVLLLLLTQVSLAAKSDYCRTDLEDLPIPWPSRFGSPSEEQAMRALRPALLRIQDDICRCLRRPRHRPETVDAKAVVAPNAGELLIHYSIAPDMGEAGERMLACMGTARLTFAPFPYRSDALTGDDREQTFRYPFKVGLEDRSEGRRPQ
jgi:hypothetical protein